MNLKKNTHPRTQRALIITQHIVIIFHLLARRLWRCAHAKKWKIKWEPWKSACIFFSLRWTNKCRMGGGGPGRVWVAKQALGSHWIIQRAGGRTPPPSTERSLCFVKFFNQCCRPLVILYAPAGCCGPAAPIRGWCILGSRAPNRRVNGGEQGGIFACKRARICIRRKGAKAPT